MFNIQLNVQERQLFTFIILQFTLESTLQTIMNNKGLNLAQRILMPKEWNINFCVFISLYCITLIINNLFALNLRIYRKGYMTPKITNISTHGNAVKYIYIKNGLENVIYDTALSFNFLLHVHCGFFANSLKICIC